MRGGERGGERGAKGEGASRQHFGRSSGIVGKSCRTRKGNNLKTISLHQSYEAGIESLAEAKM